MRLKPVMAVLAIGLTPMRPRIAVSPVVEIPALDRIANPPADARGTGGIITSADATEVIARTAKDAASELHRRRLVPRRVGVGRHEKLSVDTMIFVSCADV
jgi:hypothetical protein